MKIPLTMKLLNVIILIQDYKTFLIDYEMIYLENAQFDWFSKVQAFYNSLDLPEGIQKNRMDFKAVLNYPVTADMRCTEAEDLPKRYNFKNF